jgi:glycosyltransferase involved in cell wall biosynthesis
VREQLGWTKDHWVIGYVGRLAYIKGVDLLADAFIQARRSLPHGRLLVVGSGEEEKKLRAVLNKEITEGIVHIESDVSHDHLAAWYRAMDLFVMPSRYENYSNAVLEALGCGVPFLVSDIGGNRHFATSKGGWLFSCGSADSLGYVLDFIARNPCLAKHRGVVGEEHVRQRYSWVASAERLEWMFQSCLERRM